MGGGVHGWVRGRVLGRGSTASVFLAARATPAGAEKFAVKSAELSRSATLQREGRILSSLCSPHVVSCFGSDVTAERDGCVLYNLFVEYVQGGTLSEEVKWCGGLGEQRMRLYTRGILRGLEYLHSAGIAHCDVKGQNVLLGEDGAYVKLADLGCARWVGGGDDDDDGGRPISGTPLYMAPEVARGEEQGTEADIWALGCTVIEMATGRLPWSDAVADPVAAIHRIAFSADVPDFPCNASDCARDFLGRCLKRDPRERWTAEQLLKHPFVNCTEEFAEGCAPESKKISSPRSTLDQLFWDSWPEREEEEPAQHFVEDCHPEAQRCRLRQLASSSSRSLISPAADSTWCDDCWFTVRNGTEVGCVGVDSSVSPAAVCSKDDRIAVAMEEPSTSDARSAGKRVGRRGGGEESAENRGHCAVVTTVEDFLLPNSPSCEHCISDNNPPFDVDEGDFLICAQICYHQIPKHQILFIDAHYNDDDDDLVMILKLFSTLQNYGRGQCLKASSPIKH